MNRIPMQSTGRIQRKQTIAKYELGGLLLAVMIAGSLFGCRPKQTLNARVWVSQGENYTFPESTHGVNTRTGICLSGGGTRALTAAMGQLRGLRKLNLLSEVDYLSSVSGGTWAAAAFTFYNSGAEHDDQFLGPITDPKNINDGILKDLPPSRLGHTATRDFEGILAGLLLNLFVPRDQVWIRAVGETFLEPFGLYDSRKPNSHYFSWDQHRVNIIKGRNPPLEQASFHTVRKATDRDSHRPYLVANSCLVWPVDFLRPGNLVPFEYTPLYVGSPFPLTIYDPPLHESEHGRTIGGGYLEPFAFGSRAPAEPPNDEGLVQVEKRLAPFSLANAAGTSSAAYAVTFDPVDAALSPHMNYWPVTDTGGAPTYDYSFGDGGSLENFGLIALLRRKVENIVVFINTETPLSLVYSPENDNLPTSSDITDRLPQLFGVPIRTTFSTYNPYPNNHVFHRHDFAKVVRKLQAAKAGGHGAVARTRLVVKSNRWWGVPGDWPVNICWVYLDRAPKWEIQLPGPIRQEIEDGNQGILSHGRFKNFPNYATFAENPGQIIRLTKPQVNLMADLTCWIVTHRKNKIAEFLRRSDGAND